MKEDKSKIAGMADLAQEHPEFAKMLREGGQRAVKTRPRPKVMRINFKQAHIVRRSK